MNTATLARELSAEADRLERQVAAIRQAADALKGSPTREKRDHAGELRAQRKRRNGPKVKDQSP